MNTEPTKTCTQCGTEHPLSFFQNHKSQKDGKASRCKSCAHEYKIRYYAENRERILAYQSEYSKNNPEVGLRANRKYYENHGDAILGRAKIRNLLNPEVVAGYRRKSKKADPLRYLFTHTRSRATRSGIPFEIKKEDLSTPDVCPVLDIPLRREEAGRTDNTPSLDKLVPELGYVPGNVSIISFRANTIKADGTAEEHRRIAEWIEDRLVHVPENRVSFSDQTEEAQQRAQTLLGTARKRCKKTGITFTITEEDVIIPDVCPVLGIPIVFGPGKTHDNSPSLDKIIPELGYVPGNVAVISWRANRIKNVGTAEEHRKVADWMDAQLELLAA